ncbi:MAG: hypothetical protein EXR62_12285 [Chloroflexi bacterium]|nr:hypothetical protein [Chloroflexota bacterium]
MEPWIAERIKALRADRVSGATDLTRQGAALLRKTAELAPQALQITAEEIMRGRGGSFFCRIAASWKICL